jgi:hypothetical protein
MKKEDQDALAAAGAKWNAATSQAEKDAAHAEAEAIRAKYNYSGGTDGSQYIPISNTGTKSASGNNQYSGVTADTPMLLSSGGGYTPIDNSGNNYASMAGMSDLHQAALEAAGKSYNDAVARGDYAAAEDAHKQAEQIRALYGYSGGTDGSQYLPTQQFNYAPAPTYSDPYSKRIDKMLNDILNREDFSYDASTDPLYAQYKEQYTREGQRAMKDTMGQVSARTGGLASSYAASAAAQQNNYYMQQLSDKIPELYQMAYQMYLDDIDLQVQDLGLLKDASSTAYNRYRDTMADWRDDRDFAYGMYRDDIADDRYKDEWQHQLAQDALAQENWMKEFLEKQTQWDESLQLDRDKFDESKTQWDESLALDRDKFGYQKEQDALTQKNWEKEFGLDYNKFLDSQDQWKSSLQLDRDKLAEEKRQFDADNLIDDEDDDDDNGGKGGKGGNDDTEYYTDENGIKHPKTIQGKPIDEYSDAAGNYQECAKMAADIYAKDGRNAAIAFLEEARESGALNVTDYAQLKKKYRDMK